MEPGHTARRLVARARRRPVLTSRSLAQAVEVADTASFAMPRFTPADPAPLGQPVNQPSRLSIDPASEPAAPTLVPAALESLTPNHAQPPRPRFNLIGATHSVSADQRDLPGDAKPAEPGRPAHSEPERLTGDLPRSADALPSEARSRPSSPAAITEREPRSISDRLEAAARTDRNVVSGLVNAAASAMPPLASAAVRGELVDAMAMPAAMPVRDAPSPVEGKRRATSATDPGMKSAADSTVVIGSIEIITPPAAAGRSDPFAAMAQRRRGGRSHARRGGV